MSVCVSGRGGKPAENATFLNTQEMQSEPQFLSDVTVCASAELRGPLIAWTYLRFSQERLGLFCCRVNGRFHPFGYFTFHYFSFVVGKGVVWKFL